MNQDTFLYTLPQWIIFSAIVVIAYGWVEQKKVFRIIGTVILILLGVFAAFAISAGYFAAGQFLTPDELVSQQMDEELTGEIPFQARLLPAYLSFIVSGILAFRLFISTGKIKNQPGCLSSLPDWFPCSDSSSS
jgi:hypothetical protein